VCFFGHDFGPFPGYIRVFRTDLRISTNRNHSPTMNEEPAPATVPASSDVHPAAPDATSLLEPAKVLAAASDPVRNGLLRILADGTSLSVADLAGQLGRTAELTSKHLKVMRDARLIVGVDSPDGDGRKQFYQIPAPFRTRDAAGKRMLDFGAMLLRF